jgi:signal transduction histidine kinase
VLRYRLYDLSLVIQRTLAYALASAMVAAIYLTVVAITVTTVAGATATLGTHLLAAVAAAASFHPVLVAVQRAVQRVFYGDRSRPYDAVTQMAHTIERSLLPEQVLPDVVATVARALRLSFVAIELAGDDSWDRAAVHGTPTDPVETFAMTYQGVTVGRLLVSSRRGEARLSDLDRQVLGDLARQAGVAAQAVRTAAALQRSRAELVTAREEERRRLRRDLHDGLGPTLAGVTLGLHAAQNRVAAGQPDDALPLLRDLEQQVETAVLDVRRLVYGLRPPALDEFGLVQAVAMHGSKLDGPDLKVTVTPSRTLGRLPAAVEVAAYRIATEALTNVARHAAARACSVRFTLNGALTVEVQDDGQGIAPDSHAGVGLTAMRERADELGGSLVVESGPAGTRVLAQLPTEEVT